MRWLRRRWFEFSAGLACFLWALLGWLTVVPNQDILADGIQAQRLLQAPRLVLAFPGQKHGGPLEYPFTLMAEWLAPGNYFANAAVRLVLAFLTGFLVARLFLRLFPSAPRWAFLTAIVVGPTIIHGMLGPEGNPVGVWWLQPNWDVAWLLVTAGALVFAGAAGRPWWASVGGGLLVGLGFFAHPAISLLIVPLLTLVALRRTTGLRVFLLAAGGAALGVLPAAVSYVVNAGVNTWDPSHGAFIAVDYYLSMGGAVLGLTGMQDYMLGLLPFAIGLAPSQTLLPALVQSALMWVFVIVVIGVSAVAVVRAVRTRSRLSVPGAVALSWVVAIATMFVFITFVDPVWIYSSGLAVLFWLSVGVLPMCFRRRPVGITVTVVVLALVLLSTVSHNAGFYANIPARAADKVQVMNERYALADAIRAEGASVIFGSYYDAIPIGYASGGALRTITNRYNRFPLTKDELAQDTLVVAVNTTPTDPWGEEALATVQGECTPVRPASGATEPFALFTCPPTALDFRQ